MKLFDCSRILVLGMSLLTAACVFFTEGDKTADGGGSDTETLTGLVATSAGVPAARTMVKLFPSDYDPSHPDTGMVRYAITDDNGHFRFGKLGKDRAYNLVAGTHATKSWAYAMGLKAGLDSHRLTLGAAKVFLFSMHSDTYSQADSGIAYFPGTDILTHCNGLTASAVDSVPEGALHFIVASRSGWQHDTTLAAAEDTTKVSASLSQLKLIP